MEKKQIVICADCGKQEEYNMKPGYPRKYCSTCSTKRKAEYSQKTEAPETEAPKAVREAILMSAKDEMIVAQVILKGAVELATSAKWDNSDTLGEYLYMCVNELTGAYKLALSNVKAL